MRFWWYMVGETSTGPISQTQLEQLFEAGDVTSRSMVWTEGLVQWQEIGLVDEEALPPITTTPAIGENPQNTQNSVSPSVPKVTFQGLEGTIDIVEVAPTATTSEKVAPAPVIEPEIVVSEVAPQVEYVEPITKVEVHEISMPAPIARLSSDSLLEKTPVFESSASFLETARQGRVQMPKKKKAQPAPVSNIKPKKSLLPLNLSRLYLMGGVAGLVTLLGVGGFFMLSTSSASQKAWTNPETFQIVNLAESWKTHKSINAEQQIFYRFSHAKEPIIVQFGKETFLEETSLKDYGELFSMSIEENIHLGPKGIEGKVGQVDSLTFEGYKKRDHTQKVSVSFVKHGNEIWRTLVVNTSGGRAKTKSYQILRRKLMDSLR